MDANSRSDIVPHAGASAVATPLTSKLALAGAWLAVGLPLLWGIGQTFKKVLALFRI